MQTTEKLTPLARRLERLDNKLPSNDLYGQRLAQHLQQLLVIPVSELFGQDREGLEDYWSKQSSAAQLLEDSPATPPPKQRNGTFASSYQGQLELIYRLMKETDWAWSLSGRDKRVTAAEELLTMLADALVALREPQTSAASAPPKPKQRQSLQAKLNSAQRYAAGKTLKELVGGVPPACRQQILLDHTQAKKFPVLALPLPHYFYAAALLAGNDIPLKAGKEWFKQGFRCNFSLAFSTLIDLDKDPLTDFGGVDFSSLYQLLVEPIFPHENI